MTTQEQTKGRDAWSWVFGKGCRTYILSLAALPYPAPWCVQHPEDLGTPLFRVFMDVPLPGYDWWKIIGHGASNSLSNPSPLPRNLKVGWKFLPSKCMVGSSGDQPSHSWSHLMSISSNVFERRLFQVTDASLSPVTQESMRVLELCPELRAETTFLLLLILLILNLSLIFLLKNHTTWIRFPFLSAYRAYRNCMCIYNSNNKCC